MRRGTVYFVGAGPGHPGLITLRGWTLLRAAEVVVHDRLVHPELLRAAPPSAERWEVGREPGRGGPAPEEVAERMARMARLGKRVVRLKGGDPTVFGRAGEEAEVLARLGVPFEIVPGVTSAVAVPAYAGVPVTHRAFASLFAVTTGHRAQTRQGPPIPWEAVSRLGGTLVVLMVAAALEEVVERLRASGYPPEAPAMAVEWGALPRQRVVEGTLAELPRRARSAGLGPPALLAVGEAVRLRPLLAWYERGPLFRRRVGLFPGHGEVAWALEAVGAEPVELPAPLRRPGEPGRRLEALRRLEGFAGLAFLDGEAVEEFWSALAARGLDARALGGKEVVSLGPGTARALRARGILPDRVLPPDGSGDPGPGPLLVLGEEQEARRWARSLQVRGIPAEPLPLYEEWTPEAALLRLRELLAQGLDALILAAPEEVRRLTRMAGEEGPALPPSLCLGEDTLQAARSAGLPLLGASDPHPVAAVEALQAALKAPVPAAGPLTQGHPSASLGG